MSSAVRFAASLVTVLGIPLAAFCGIEDADGQDVARATASIRNLDGDEIGRATLTEGAVGVVVAAELDDLPPGTHAFHVHETGACAPPFESAGGHAHESDTKHGILSPGGMHVGDMPNLHVPDSGEISVDAFVEGATLGSGEDGRLPLLTGDGSALVLHAGADDYATDPAGNAGDRIACGVITR